MGWVKNPNTSNIQWKTGRKKKKTNFTTSRVFLKPIFMPKYLNYYHV